ncbi:MAG: hypothetical protein HS108_00680 [Planctomycetes bacterium]|jgi:hypothetical protein|nr:hypothetical protein [Planctomycetota bacterium]MCL4730888.1 hypothetical protein [Planctomycetota bacterium]
MKRILLALAFTGILAAPAALAAQEGVVEGEAEESPQELLAKLHKLMKEASKEMGELEKELAKASLSAPKADVVKERLDRIRKAMQEGKLDDLPEGLRKEIQDNPEDVARATGKSTDEVRKLAEDEAKLRELLEKNPELLKKLAQNEETMQRVLEKQNAVEKRLAETLQKQEQAAEAARKSVDEAVDLAHKLRQQGQGQGQGQPKNKGEKTKDGREKEQQQGNPNQPNKGADSQYQPGEGEGPRNDKTEDFERSAQGGAQFEKKGKDMGDGSGNDSNRREPEKYKDFWKKFQEDSRKKIEERKSEGK